MRLPLVIYPAPQLAEPSVPVTEVTDALRTLAADMAETMYENDGIGLAAPQVGHNIRMIVVDVTGPEKHEDLMILLNPVLTPVAEEGSIIGDEGCLSVPLQYRAKVERAAKVRVQATDLDGKAVDFEAEDLLAVCLQHETDHLNGVLFLDHLSHLKRSMYDARLRKRGTRRVENAPLI